MRMYGRNGQPWFRVGDLVSRDGTDVQRVIGTRGEDPVGGHAPDLIEVVCVKAPSAPWCQVGDTEDNCASRYDWAGDALLGDLAAGVIEGEVTR